MNKDEGTESVQFHAAA